MSDSDTSDSLYYSLRSKKIPRNETDRDKRVKIVDGWPKRKRNMAAKYDEDCKHCGDEENSEQDQLGPTAPQLWSHDEPQASTPTAPPKYQLHINEELITSLQRGINETQALLNDLACGTETETSGEVGYGAPTSAYRASGKRSGRQVVFDCDLPADDGCAQSLTKHPIEDEVRSHGLASPAVVRPPETVTLPANLVVRSLATTRTISDTVVAPKPFTGKAGQEAESWLEYLERYANFRKLSPLERQELFCILMHDGAADWLMTLPNAYHMTYAALTQAFRDAYFKSPELQWREAGDLWNQAQRADERVEDFVTRLRKAARRLNFPDQVLHYAVIAGLRPQIRLHVVQQGVRTLDDTLRAAKVAEAAAATTPDAVSVVLLEAIKASAQASEKQAAEIKNLTARVAALTAVPDAREIPALMTTAAERSITQPAAGGQRQLRPTPQNQQRANYAQRAATRTDAGPRSFRQPGASGPECGRCGWRHEPGNCRADGQECRQCGRRGHFARVCRSARAGRN